MNWNWFSKKKESEDLDQVSAQTQPGQTAKKGRPTPKRRDAENARLTPLVPKDRKAQRKAETQRRRERENREYEAMRDGDLHNMPRSEQLPWRIYIRDYVDARYNLGEYFMIVIIVLMIAALIAGSAYPPASLYILILMYVYFAAVIIDAIVMWRRLKKKLIEKFGERSVAKGMRSGYYAWSRSLQIRAWRLPKPRHKKHGQYPQ